MSQIEEASCDIGRIRIDSPIQGLAVLDTAIYTDPAGFGGELFHYRSYNVKDRTPLPYQQLKRQMHETRSKTGLIYFTHFTPNYSAISDYNACYFHAIFQPNSYLQADLDRHNSAIGKGPSIGIHYRTGDKTAFGIANSDNRVPGQTALKEGLDAMLECAKQLAEKLFPAHPLNDVAFYLATDNAEIKEVVRQQRQQQKLSLSIYTTDVVPGSYLRGNSGDGDAWLEIFLLSMRQGLVANVLPNDYGGTAKQLSKFAVLAKKIGFMEESQVMQCVLDSPTNKIEG